MNQGTEFPRITKSDLLSRLATGHEARACVVTPNQRLAASLRRSFDARQAAEGRRAWEAADMLPLDAFIERLYRDALYSDLAGDLPALLAPAQERALWEDIVRASEAGSALMWKAAAAGVACEAWRLVHAWRLLPRFKDYPVSEDARAFADWAWRYEGTTRREGCCDHARLADVIAPHLAQPALAKPAMLIVYGFDMMSVQQREFLASLGKAGVEVCACAAEVRDARVRKVAFASAKDEMLAAARWARERLEADPGVRIGLVVPDLAGSRARVHRTLTQVLEPAHVRGGAEPLPFNFSLGEPLSSYPPAAAALRLLEFAHGDVAFEQASALLRSPFIAGAETELAPRAQLDAALRRIVGADTSLERMRRAIARITAPRNSDCACPVLLDRLARLSDFADERLRGAKRAGEWARLVTELLAIAGFPGERTPDSTEYQVIAKFNAAIAEFSALERVIGPMRYGEAYASLARIASETLFQPEAPQVPIQVLGVLESAGLEFDHLWVSGLSDEAWPIPARPNPFIPVALQRAAGVPGSTPELSQQLDARITQGWCSAAPEVVLSYPLREQDRDLAPSPLIRELAESELAELALPAYAAWRDLVHCARAEERLADARGPAIAAGRRIDGGAGVFRNQAACPFRAFAAHRLQAEDLVRPVAGLDAADRGTLVHALLARLWRELKSSAALGAATDAELEALLAQAADRAIAQLRARKPDSVEGRYARLERARLMKLGRAWLEAERVRAQFSVVSVEQSHLISLGGLAVLTRLDRVDHIVAADGIGSAGYAVIDYKTGGAGVGNWLGPRPDDPQLPLYAVTQDPQRPITAVAYARVRAGEMGFNGIACEDGLIPGVKPLAQQRVQAARNHGSWEELLRDWRRELEALGAEFSSGDARVAPKRGGATCRHCGLEPLCRINERATSESEGA